MNFSKNIIAGDELMKSIFDIPSEESENKPLDLSNKFSDTLFRILNDDIKSKIKVHDLGNTKIEYLDKLESLSQVAWILYSKEYNTTPCEYTVENDYDLTILDFYRENGKLITRKVYDHTDRHSPELHYLFSHEDYYICFGVYITDKILEGVIRSVTFYHNPNNLINSKLILICS